jgi:hypothetical protein
MPDAVNASAAWLISTLLATVVGALLTPLRVTVSTKFTVPVGVSGDWFATTVGLIEDCRKSVTGAVPLVKVAKFPPPSETSTLPVVVLPAFPTVTVIGFETLGANVPSPA